MPIYKSASIVDKLYLGASLVDKVYLGADLVYPSINSVPKLLWLDADDINTITEDVGGVSLWQDKSGNSNDAVQTDNTKRLEFAITPNRLTEISNAADTQSNMSVDFTGGGSIVAYWVQVGTKGVFTATVNVPDGVWKFTQLNYLQFYDVKKIIITNGLVDSLSLDIVKTYMQAPANNFGTVANFGSWFYNRTELVALDASDWDTSSATSFLWFARGCSNLTTLYVSSWNTSNVQFFYSFIFGCSSLTTLDVSNWNTISATSFESFARFCTNLVTLNVSNWNTVNVTTFSNFVDGCTNLLALNVSTWNTSKVTNFGSFVLNCSKLTTLNVSNWDTALVTNFSSFASGCTLLTTLNISNWNTSSVTSFNRFAYLCNNLTTIVVTGGTGNPFADSSCTDYSLAFNNTNLTTQSIDDILVAINSAGTSNGTFNQSGGTNSPSATGIAAKNAMISRGWTVTTN